MANLNVQEDEIVGSIKGQLLAGGIGALIMLLVWTLGFNSSLPQQQDTKDWFLVGLFVILPISLFILLAPLHIRRAVEWSRPQEEQARFFVFASRYHHVSLMLFWWMCFVALPAVILRWSQSPRAVLLASIVALLCGVNSSIELWRYYRKVELYYKALPVDLLKQEIEEAKKRERGATVLGLVLVNIVSQGYRQWRQSQTPPLFPGLQTPLWQDWAGYATFFIIALGVTSELLFSLMVHRWSKDMSTSQNVP